ncbi:hypothetical protein AGDE_13938 [Angomonas deanei]|uniref:YEATS family, putative n=1 Tax=Angomonas deanei TaxID=59799 RepID=A0A7G2CJS3_9TRYP|nr:hypothetical protein AGDE_13938 [Angomonas deanei]CAD2220046.1 YEATS family, putative [Angomonas deanei]|eukprot:EPY21589.1 hypothetical protein AGDE_13938 [Angomonas deanei]
MSIVYCRDFKVQFKQRTFLLKNLSHDDFKTIKEVVVYFLKNYNHNTTHKLKSAEIHHKTVTNHYYICSTASDFDSRVTKTGSSENENELTEEREISFNIPFATSPRAFAIYPLHENTQKPRKLYTKKIDVLVHSSRDSSVSSATMSGGTPPVPVVPLKRKRGRPPKVRPAETAERPKTAPVTLVEVLPGNQRRSLSVDVDGRRRSSEHKKPHTTTPTIQEVRVRSSSVKEIEGTSDSEEGGRVKKGGVVSAALLQKKHKEKKRKTEEEDSTDSEHPYHPVANNEEYLREKKLREEAERARLLKKQTEENNATYRRQIKYFMNEHTTSHNNNHHNSNSDPPPPFVSDDLLQMGNRRDYYNQFYLNYFVKKSMLDPRNATTMKQALQETIETLKKKSPHPNTDYNAAFSEHKTKSLLLSSPESYLFNPFVQLYKPSEFYHHPHPKKSVLLPIVVGSCVEYVSREEEQRSHQWTVYVRGLFNGKYSHTSSDHYLSKCIEKVVFVLDKSFANPIRVVTEMPFEVTERGWGEFAVGVHVYLKVNREEGLGAKDILKFRTGVSRGGATRHTGSVQAVPPEYVHDNETRPAGE